MTSTQISPDLDAIFEALSNKHRREIVYLLGLQPCSISYLSSVCRLSLPAIYKHIKILENSGMIMRKKIGRTNFLTRNKNSLIDLQNWIWQFQTHWGSSEETLENYAKYLEKNN